MVCHLNRLIICSDVTQNVQNPEVTRKRHTTLVQTWEGVPPAPIRKDGVTPTIRKDGETPPPPDSRMGVPPPKSEQTETCENSTFPQHSDARGNKVIDLFRNNK